jgi:CBS domain-containing protein
VARLYGVKVKSITLWFLGGVADFQELPMQRGAEAVVAIVGPIVSFFIAAIFWVSLRALPAQYVPSRFVFAYLAYMNAMLAVFNLVPAIPLDGGRVLRSVVALWMPRERATAIAAAVSRTLAVLMGVLGLVSLNFFLLVIAIFIYMAVNVEAGYSEMERLLRGFTVADVMTRDVHVVPPDLRVSELIDRMFEEHRLGYPVADRDGHLLGLVTLDQVRGQDPAMPVGSVVRNEVLIAHPEEQAINAFKRMGANGFQRTLVVDRESHVVGIMTKTDLLRLLQLRAAHLLPHPRPMPADAHAYLQN